MTTQWTETDDQKIREARIAGVNRKTICEFFPERTAGAVHNRISYLSEIDFDRKNGIKYTRNCPVCNVELSYPDRSSLAKAVKSKSICVKCAGKKRGETYIGENHPSFGKKFSPEICAKFSEIRKRQVRTPEQIAALHRAAQVYRETHAAPIPYAAIRRKFGDAEADRRRRENHKRTAERMAGKGNHMYGKPTPTGSGNGWKSWYRGIHFRSLRELQYYINTTEIEGRSCENIHMLKGFRVSYLDEAGGPRTYCPDFLVDGKTVVEIKPVKLWNTRENVAKREAAIPHFAAMGLNFQFVDVLPDSKCIRERYLKGEIRLVHRYIERFEKYANITPAEKGLCVARNEGNG